MMMWHDIETWLGQNESWVAWGVGISVLTFVGSLIAVPMVVIGMRADYFVEGEKSDLAPTPLRVLRHLGKNVLGAVLLLMGVAMLFLPGQGLLTILLGLSLVDFPGKRSLQLRLLRTAGVRRSVDWMRAKADKAPLVVPD